MDRAANRAAFPLKKVCRLAVVGTTIGCQVGVHYQNADLLEGQAKLLGGGCGKHANQVLPHFGAAGANFGMTVGIDLHLGLGGLSGAPPPSPVFLYPAAKPQA
jgi:hypothetical protein